MRHPAGRQRFWITVAALSLVLAALFAPLPVAEAAPQTRHIHVDASSFDFKPGVIRVNRGDKVVLTVESLDVVHGIYVDGYGVSVTADPGQPAQLVFAADRSGSFHFRCSVPCGNLHPFMIGKLIVEPNLTWLRAVLASVVATVGALAVFWRSPV